MGAQVYFAPYVLRKTSKQCFKVDHLCHLYQSLAIFEDFVKGEPILVKGKMLKKMLERERDTQMWDASRTVVSRMIELYFYI